MRNVGLDAPQAGIKISGRNINNLRYADNTTFMAESKEELKSLLMKVKENEKAGLKLNIQKRRSWHPVPSLHGNRWGNNGNSDILYFHIVIWGSKITADGDYSHEIKRHFLLGRKAMTNLDSMLKSRDITLPKEVQSSQSYGVSNSHVWM